MKDGEIIPFPIKGFQRQKNAAGRHAALCIVSERWLQFPEQGSGTIQIGEPLAVCVMTKDRHGNDKKICELMVTREDLLNAIAAVKPPANK